MLLFYILFSVFLIIALVFLIRPFFTHKEKKPSVVYLVLAGVVFSFFSIGLYLMIGQGKEFSHFLFVKAEQSSIAQSVAEYRKSPQKLVMDLENHLREDPGSTKGWFLLGKLYLSLQQPEKAVPAFAKANELKPNTPMIMVKYAESLFVLHHMLDAQSKALIHQALLLEPQNIDAYRLLTLDALKNHRDTEAIHYLQVLVSILPSDSEEQQKLLLLIEKIQKRLK